MSIKKTLNPKKIFSEQKTRKINILRRIKKIWIFIKYFYWILFIQRNELKKGCRYNRFNDYVYKWS